MRIAINADILADAHTDAAQYFARMIEALGMVDGVNEYSMLSHRDIALQPATPSTFQWETVAISAPNERLRTLTWEQRTFAETAKKADAKLLYTPTFASPAITSIPFVVTAPDLVSFALTTYHPSSAQWMYLQLLSQTAKKAAAVVALSERTKTDLIRYCNIPMNKITQIAIAPRPQFHEILDFTARRNISAKYGLADSFVLYRGGFDARRNITLLIGAFAAAMNRAHDTRTQLVIVGKLAKIGSSPLYPDWRQLFHRFGIEGQVVLIDEQFEELPVLYSLATAFIYPSHYEGSGLPVIEAMACGAPIIASEDPAIQETLGAASIPFTMDPFGEPASKQAIRGLSQALVRITQDFALREEFHQRSLARARLSTWSQPAAELSGIFAEAAGMRV